MTLKPDLVIHVNHEPKIAGFDLIERVQEGVKKATDSGFDLCYIVENDDAYPADYFERFAPYFETHDFFGQEHSDYYHLRNLTHNRFEHQFRSSLFTTGFKISALNNFDWPDSSKPFLDIDIWKYARHKRRIFVETGAIGIKHGLGLCGGKGHKLNMKNRDPEMKWLAERVDPESLEFYRGIGERLQSGYYEHKHGSYIK